MTEAPTRRTRRNRTQWQELINQQQDSCLSASAFCKEYNLGYASFCKWRQRLSSSAEHFVEHPSEVKSDFIDLSCLPDTQRLAWHIVLKLGDGMELQLTRS